jgi:hypothetical protein
MCERLGPRVSYGAVLWTPKRWGPEGGPRSWEAHHWKGCGNFLLLSSSLCFLVHDGGSLLPNIAVQHLHQMPKAVGSPSPMLELQSCVLNEPFPL